MRKVEIEKALKRYLKKSIGYSLSLLVAFLITGEISLGAGETKVNLETPKVTTEKKGNSSIQFFFNWLFERKDGKESNDNGYSDLVRDWGDDETDGGIIEIPPIREEAKPIVPEIDNPLPDDEDILDEPNFDFDEVGDIAINDKPGDIGLGEGIATPPNNVINIGDSDFQTIDSGSIVDPGKEIGKVDLESGIGTSEIGNVDTEVGIKTGVNVGDIKFFTPPSVNVAVSKITAPDSFSIGNVKITTDGLDQSSGDKKLEDNSEEDSVVQNYNSYGSVGESTNIRFSQNDISYGNGKNSEGNIDYGSNYQEWGEDVIYLDGNLNGTINDRPILPDRQGEALRKYYMNAPVTAFITDLHGWDTLVEGVYNINYNAMTKQGDEPIDSFVKIFLSVNPAGLATGDYGSVTDIDQIKITKVQGKDGDTGEINLTTSETNGIKFNGNLIALEHQLWDKFGKGNKEHFDNSYSVLLNQSNINLGNSKENGVDSPYSKNMIGIMIDMEESSEGLESTKVNHKTINAGNINIYGTNSIGISFEEYRNKYNLDHSGHFILRDDLYVGNINVNGTQNYGLRLGNIFADKDTANTTNKAEFDNYYDKVKVIGDNGGSIVIDDIDTEGEKNSDKNSNVDGETIEYTHVINVSGTQNAGMVVGKSLSASAKDYIGADDGKVNPIANFSKLNVVVDGNQTIGFVRDRNYSDNNKNVMVINNENFNNLSFGTNAKDSVLIRSEMYGVENQKDLSVDGISSDENSYNVVMQGTRQSWDKTGDKTLDTNSTGYVINSGAITGDNTNRMIGLMASGTLTDGVTEWQNGEQGLSTAKATNSGEINFTGNNNIGMAILEGNSGENNGTITITGKEGTGIYNDGGDVTSSGTINMSGESTIGITNIGGKLTLGGTVINLQGGENSEALGSTAIYTEGGNINFGTTTINGGENSDAGVYAKNNTAGETTLQGTVNIIGTKAGIVAEGTTVKAETNGVTIGYSGDGFALYTKSGENGTDSKIVLNENSNLVLGGNAYGINIDTSKSGDNKLIDLDGADIHINSNDVTIFNIVDKEGDYTIKVGDDDILSGLKDYVGNITENDIISNGNEGYKIASIDGGVISLDGKADETENKNREFLEKYRFQKSKVTMTSDTDMTLNNADADIYFKGDVIGIGMSSSNNIKVDATGEEQRAETQINIENGTLTANRTENSDHSTIGAYVDFGEVNLTGGNIVVEKISKDGDTANSNSVGIYAKNGSKVTTNEGTSIEVNGDNSIGIYAEATKSETITNGKNQFGGNITTLEVTNGSDITINGASGVGIYADNSENENRAKVTNSGTITVGTGTSENASVGIYGINSEITHSGVIDVGEKVDSSPEDNSIKGVGIYADNSTVTVNGEENNSINLGSDTVGIYLTGDSSITSTDTIKFGNLETANQSQRIGIQVVGNENSETLELTSNIDISEVNGGKAIVSKDRDITSSGTISISGINGRGIRVDGATATNSGTINIGTANTKAGEEVTNSSVGMLATNNNGVINNSNGTININGEKGIGIYVENNGVDKIGNSVTGIGTINLGANNSKGIVLKGTDITLGKGKNQVTSDGINFADGVNNGVAIYGDSSNITVSEDISRTLSGKDNILIAGVNGSTITNNNSITVTSNGKDDEHNIGVYLGENSTYTKNGKSGKVIAKDGAIGIYSTSNKALNDISVEVNSNGTQTIGVVLEGENKEKKIISGNISLGGNLTKDTVDKKVGVYANNSNVYIEKDKSLTFDYTGSDGVGLYLNNSTLSGDGSVNIEGSASANGKNSVGIYYKSNESSPIISNNNIDVNINKNNTIGVFVADGNKLMKGENGSVSIGTGNTTISDATGIVIGKNSLLGNAGDITLDKTDKGIGIASLGGEINNSGTITLTADAKHGTGVFLAGNGSFNGEKGTIKIDSIGNQEGVGIGIYVKDSGVIENTGNFEMESGNIAVYSDGADVDTDINLVNGDKNIGTTALMVKSNADGTIVGGSSSDDKMNITLAKGSTGIDVLDSGVKVQNVVITANEDVDTETTTSTGILLRANEENKKAYEVDNTEITLKKGIGIAIDTGENSIKSSLDLTNSKLTVNSTSEGNNKETGIGIYVDNGGDLNLNGENTLTVDYGIGIYGANNSTIDFTGTNNVELKDYSVGVYTKNSKITIGEGTTFTGVEGNTTQGDAIYIDGGSVTNSGTITIDNGENFTGIYSSNKGSITNNGDINISGNKIFGLVSSDGGAITNSGNLVLSKNVDEAGDIVGIYSNGGSIESTGAISVTGGTAVAYVGNNSEANINISGDIKLSGATSSGVVLSGTKDESGTLIEEGRAKDITIGDISADNSVVNNQGTLGIYMSDFAADSLTTGNIKLGDNSMGVYIENSSVTNAKLGDITVGTNGIGLAFVGEKGKVNDNMVIAENGEITVGEKGTAVYVKDGNLSMDSMANINVGNGGTFIHVNGGNLTLGSTISDIVLDGNIGMIIDNGGNINAGDGSKIDNITVKDGGTALVVRGNSSARPDIFTGDTKITLESGAEDGEYSLGVYYQQAGDIGNLDTVDINYQDGASRTLGTVYDRTYGTLENVNITMNNSISESIGTMIRRTDSEENKITAEEDEKGVKLVAEENNNLVTINGNGNIGIVGINSIIDAKGNISVGLETTSENSVGVYLTSDTNTTIKHGYTGEGNIDVGSSSMGIYAENYDITQEGNITVTGSESVGIALVKGSGHTAEHTHSIKVTGDITANEGAIGVYGRDGDIIVTGDISTSGEQSTAIANLGEGDITFNGDANIQGKGSMGIYMNNDRIGDESLITVGIGEWTIGDEAIGIYANSNNINNGNIEHLGDITINNSANMNLGAGAVGIYSMGINEVINSGDIDVGSGIHGRTDVTSIGIYMTNGLFGGVDTVAHGENTGNITVDENGSVGVQIAGNVEFTNKGIIDITDNGSGIGAIASYGATFTNEKDGSINIAGVNSIGMIAQTNDGHVSKVINNGEVTVKGSGIGMVASGEGSQAINNGSIILEKDETLVNEDEYNTDLIGMGAFDGGKIINGKEGSITVNDGVGMYVDSSSTFQNDGTITVNDGVGIMGEGKLENTGKIVVNGGEGTVSLDGESAQEGSILVDNINRVVEINDNFINRGGLVETDFDIKLNNPTIDITEGGAGFIAPDVSGEIKLDSNFALTGNGISYEIPDFVDPTDDLQVNTSPLFDSEIIEGDLVVNKKDYKDITLGDNFDARDNSLDEILVNGGDEAEILKKLNYYLDSLGNTTMFGSEVDRIMGEIGGNAYSNIQTRMQDISRTFDNSFNEMINSPNPAYENTKYSLIYTDGESKTDNKQILDYDYSIKGLNYMKEFDETEQGRRFGYELGFAGSRFEFQDSNSQEDIYTLRGGAHHIKYYDNGVSLLTRGEVAYNHHRMDREVSFGNTTIENEAWYGSYQVSLDNKLRKSLFKNENYDLGAYTALNLEYGIFDDVKESGDLELKVKSNDYFSSKAILGIDGKVEQVISGQWKAKLTGDVNYSYDFGENYDANEVRFRADDSYYTLASEEKSRDVLSGKVSIGAEKGEYMSFEVFAQGSRDFRREEDYWNSGVSFTYKFGN